MRKLLLSIFAFLPFLVFSAKTTILGNIKGTEGGTYNNSPIEIIVVKDFITYQKEVIKKGQTDNNGNFKVSFENTRTQIAIIKLGKVERTLFIEPGKSYFVPVKAALSKLAKSKGFFAKDSRKAFIKNSIPGELNYLIDTLDKTCSNFLADNPFKRKNYKAIKTFTDSIEKVYTESKQDYFKKYLNFKIAELQMYVMRKYREDFVKIHITPNSGYATNVQSMHVVNSFFKGRVKNDILSDDNSPFHRAMLKTNLDKMLIEINPSTSDNRELNELILLKGILEIGEVYYYRKSILIKALDKIISTTKFPLHKEIAKNIKGKINHLEIGSTAPPVAIQYEGTDFNLKDYQGKYVYLTFFKGWDETFKKEVEVIDYLKSRYEEDLTVICISTDLDLKVYKNFVAQLDETDHFFHYNFDPKILSDYRIPDFRMQETHQWEKTSKHLLIGPKGDIVYNQAKAPSKGFEYDFRLLIGK